MRNPQGYATTVEPGKGTIEEDTFTCGHCNGLQFVKPREDPATMGGMCKMCMKLICSTCAGHPGCTPFEKRLEAMEARDRLRRAAGV